MTTPTIAREPDLSDAARRAAESRRAGWWLCLLIALFFAGYGLRTAAVSNVVDTDGARHAMNGAFVHDLLADGKWMNPKAFGHFYYAHFPALSMPYHPPLFPAIEGLFFFLLGVNVLAARVVVALAVMLSAILLFRLVMKTHGSVFLAALSTIAFCSTPYAFRLAADVMLEFPALVFTVLAAGCLAGAEEGFSLRRGVAFGFIAAAAVWTKQQTVFLGAVPLLYIAFSHRWRLLKTGGFWISGIVFAILVAALTSLSVPFHSVGVSQALPPNRLHVLVRNLLFYVTNYPRVMGPAGVIWTAALVVALACGLVRRKETAIYAAWAVSLLLVLLAIGPYATRYLFFAFPPLIVLGYTAVFSLAKRVRGETFAKAGVVALLVLQLAAGPVPRGVYLRGPEQAAAVLAGLHPRRILYCGGTDGNFIFNYRSAHPGFDTTIIAGDKLPRQMYTPERMASFASRYGIEYIVFERVHAVGGYVQHAWDPLFDSPPPSFVPLRDIRLSSSDTRWNGVLRIYRVTNPSPQPQDDIRMRMNMIGGTMEFKLPK